MLVEFRRDRLQLLRIRVPATSQFDPLETVATDRFRGAKKNCSLDIDG